MIKYLIQKKINIKRPRFHPDFTLFTSHFKNPKISSGIKSDAHACALSLCYFSLNFSYLFCFSEFGFLAELSFFEAKEKKMSDDEHHFESKADAGASKTYPQQAGPIRKNGYIVIKNRPCKVLLF